ncbi:hypothetical protein K2X33_00465 [bacterium]|nr:hypothetical protein [bacterium]
MKKNIHSGFFISVLALGVILLRWPVDENQLALEKLGPVIQDDLRLREQVAQHCGNLELVLNSPLERLVKEHLPVPQNDSLRSCTIAAASAQATRFGLRSHWDYQLHIRIPLSKTVAQRHYTVDFPLPIVLWPVGIFLLSLLFQFRPWGLGWTLFSYAALLAGLNLLHLVDEIQNGMQRALSPDQPWTGLFLIAGWVALCQARRMPNRRRRPPRVGPRAHFLNRAFLGFLGLWNPVALTLTGRLLVPFQARVTLLAPFLGLQVAATALSLYLLSFSGNLSEFFWDSAILPRYFTFGALLFILLRHQTPKREAVAWHLPGFWYGVGAVVAVELACWKFSLWESSSTLTRVGLALFVSQLFWIRHLEWRRFFHYASRWGSAVAIAAAVSVLSQQMGVTDLAVSLLDPRIHPTAPALFTFFAGILMGFLTGSFPVAFFALVGTLAKAAQTPLIHAALLDGVLAGLLLSPFSVHNLIPAIQFRMPVRAVVGFRFKQLGFPLLIGTVIYAISALNSVAILRPATFVFLCLLAISTQLKKTSWRVQKYTILPDSHSAGR